MKTSIMIGEMAKLHNVSKETLRYYHQIGLLVPDTIDDKGYRHYSLAQFAHLDSILFLRELGLSILEIKNYFESRNLDSITHLLEQKSLDLEAQLQLLTIQQSAIKQKLNLLNLYKSYPFETCILKDLPPRHIARWPVHSYSGIADFEYGLKHLHHSILDGLNLFKGIIGTSLKPCHTDASHFQKWDEIILIFDDTHHQSLETLPSGQYATLTYKGIFENGETHYLNLLDWIKKQGYTAGECLFLTISDSAFSSDPHESITEIQIKMN